MKLWQKLTALVLGTLLLASATGCGGSKSSGGALAKIKKAGVLKVGCKADVPGFGLKDPKTGEYKGFEIDLAKAIAKKIFNDEKKVSFQTVSAKTRGPLLDNGEIDCVVATFTITEQRKKDYNFTEPYYVDAIKLMVKEDSGIKSVKDLNGKIIGVSRSATTKAALEKPLKDLGVQVKFSELESHPELKVALDSGRINCFALDGAILNGYMDDSVILLPDRFKEQEYGIATKKDNTEMAKLVNDLVIEMKKNGEMDQLQKKWGIK